MYVESDTVELKREYTKDIPKEIIAFLNSSGGDLFIGIDDDGTVIGVEDIDATMTKLSNSIHDNIRPDAKLFINMRIIDNNIINIHVNEGNMKPYYLQGKGLRPEGVYVRLGSSSVPSSEAGIKSMMVDSMGLSFELSLSARQNLTFSSILEVFSNNNLTFTSNDYRTLKIVDSNNNYTQLGLLLSDQCKHSIKVAVFSSNDNFQFLDRREFTGSVFKVLNETLQYLHLNNHLRSSIVGYQRIEQRDYTEEILREGVLNAIIHRDYSYSGAILISVYPNRIEITSLGGLVYGLNLDDIESGISESRNPELGHIFYRLKYVEAYGTGIKKIKSEYNSLSINELIKVTDHTFKLTLWNKNYDNEHIPNKANVMREAQSSYIALSYDETKLLSLFDKMELISRHDVQEELQIGQTKSGLLLNGLISSGLIERIGGGRLTKYRKV